VDEGCPAAWNPRKKAQNLPNSLVEDDLIVIIFGIGGYMKVVGGEADLEADVSEMGEARWREIVVGFSYVKSHLS
jgi:hypothetical protein